MNRPRLIPRLLPAIIFVAALVLTVRIGDIGRSLFSLEGENLVLQVAAALAQTRNGAGDGEEAAADGEAGEEGEEAVADPAVPPEGMVEIEMTDEDVAPGFSGEGEFTPGELRLIYDLAKRRAALVEKERALEERTALLTAAEARLVERQEQLVRIRDEIQLLSEKFEQTQDEQITSLRATYTNMKPKPAAKIFNELDMDTLLSVIRGMSARKLSAIMAVMDTEKARLVTQELAHRESLPDNLPALLTR